MNILLKTILFVIHLLRLSVIYILIKSNKKKIIKEKDKKKYKKLLKI